MVFTSTTIIRLTPAGQLGVLIAACLLALVAAPSELAAQSSLNYASGVNFAVPIPWQESAVPSMAPPLPGDNITVNSPTVGAQNETSIALNLNRPNNLIGGSNDYRTGDARCGRYVSTDNALTWTDLGPFAMFTPSGGHAFTVAGDPGVAFDANGHAYYLCMYFTRSPGDNTQYVHKSNDGGATWGPPVQVSSAAAQSHFDDKGHIAVDNRSFTANRGNVYVAWARIDQGQLRFARSTNGGASFDPDIVVRTGIVQGANIAVGNDGAVYVAWWELSGPNSLINIRRSTDGGQSFGAVHTVRTFTGIGFFDPGVRPLGRVNSFPVIAADASDASIVYAIWAENPGGLDDSDTMFARSTDGGNTWGDAIRVNDDVNPAGDFNSQFFPWMAVDPIDGSINVVWYDDRLDPNRTDGTPLVDLFFASSNDQGLSFSPNKRVSTQSSNTTASFAPPFFGDYNAITAYGGVAYPLWTDSRTGDQDVVTAQIGVLQQVLNAELSGTLDPATFAFDPTPVKDGPAGTFSFTAAFCNIGAKQLTLLKSVTTTLTDGNILLNRDGGTRPGVGSELSFPATQGFADGVLSGGECVDVRYQIGLAATAQFGFLVDVVGVAR